MLQEVETHNAEKTDSLLAVGRRDSFSGEDEGESEVGVGRERRGEGRLTEPCLHTTLNFFS
jgi:hypothetical protein